MSRTFGQVPTSLWTNKRFVSLSDDARLALLFLWVGPHSTAAGIFRLDGRYAAADLDWDLKRWISARDALTESGFIEFDDSTNTVLVNGFFKCNRPQNARHQAAIRTAIASAQSEDLRAKAEAAFQNAMPCEGEPSTVTRLETSFLKRAAKQ